MAHHSDLLVKVVHESKDDSLIGKSYFKLHINVYKPLYVLASWLY